MIALSEGKSLVSKTQAWVLRHKQRHLRYVDPLSEYNRLRRHVAM